jgi:hypothetical protein
MAALMRDPYIYQGINDAMAPAPESLQFEDWLMGEQKLSVVAAMYKDHIVGFVYLYRRTSVAAELTAGFHRQVPVIVKKSFVLYTIQQGWKTGLVTIWAIIASDNRPARQGAYSCGFRQEARLTKAITRSESRWGTAGLKDMIIYSIHRPEA